MSEYVPTTDEVRECWVMAEPSPDGYASEGFKLPDEAGMYAEFDAWLGQVRADARREGQAEAFDEGWKARAEREPRVMNIRGYSAPPPPHGLNPYRREAGQ